MLYIQGSGAANDLDFLAVTVQMIIIRTVEHPKVKQLYGVHT